MVVLGPVNHSSKSAYTSLYVYYGERESRVSGLKFFREGSRDLHGMNPRVSRGIMDIDDTSMAQVSLLDAPYVTFIRRDKGASSLFFFPSLIFFLPLQEIVHTSFIFRAVYYPPNSNILNLR